MRDSVQIRASLTAFTVSKTLEWRLELGEVGYEQPGAMTR